MQALLEELLTLVLVAKPKNPAGYLCDEVKRRMEAAAAGKGKPSFFTDDDLRGIHSLFDATHNNSITTEQARTALRTLGVEAASATALPATGTVDAETWVKVAREALDKAAAGR